jgi:hypothetical protein
LGGHDEIKKTTNGGLNWVDVTPITNYWYFGLYFTSPDTGYAVSNGARIRKTTNAGQTWINQTPIGSVIYRSVYFTDINTGYVVGGSSIVKTTNGGANWYPQNSGVIVGLESVFFVNPNTGWVVGDGGTILKTTDGGGPVGIEPTANGIPKDFSLGQNYPNPFNPVTRFKVQIPKFAAVKIIVHDVLGQEIAVIVDEQLYPGAYEFEFDGSDLPSGVYFYQLTTGDYKESRKIVLSK